MVCCDNFSVFPFLHLLDIQPKFKPGLTTNHLWFVVINFVDLPSTNPSVSILGIPNIWPDIHTRKFTTCKVCSAVVKILPSSISGSLETHQEDSPILHVSLKIRMVTFLYLHSNMSLN